MPANQQEDRGFYRCYVPKVFKGEALDWLEKANKIIAEYEGKGYALSLRQLYYQMVARGMIENVVRNYDRLGDVIGNGRLAGLVSWTAIEDRGRNLMGISVTGSPREALAEVRAGYNRDKWADQPVRPEVWVEKEALEGVVGQVCNELQVDFYATRGYDSMSQSWRAGRRFAQRMTKGQRTVVFHLGDHDPSGIDMTRDNTDRLTMFAGVPIQVVRLALNMNQVDRFRPPPNPAKVTDSRYASYEAQFGDQSWELDALEPVVLHDLISDAVLRVRDHALWDAALKREAEERLFLDEVVDTFGGSTPETPEEEGDDD